MSDDAADPEPRVRDRAACGVPHTGWALGERFSWEEVHQRLLASADPRA